MKKSRQILPDKLTLLVTGSGKRTNETDTELILRTDDATLHFDKNSEFGKLANVLIYRYNERQKLLDFLNGVEQFVKDVESIGNHAPVKLKELINNAKNIQL